MYNQFFNQPVNAVPVNQAQAYLARKNLGVLSNKFNRIALIIGGIVAFLIVASVVIILAAALSKYSDSSSGNTVSGATTVTLSNNVAGRRRRASSVDCNSTSVRLNDACNSVSNFTNCNDTRLSTQVLLPYIQNALNSIDTSKQPFLGLQSATVDKIYNIVKTQNSITFTALYTLTYSRTAPLISNSDSYTKISRSTLNSNIQPGLNQCSFFKNTIINSVPVNEAPADNGGTTATTSCGAMSTGSSTPGTTATGSTTPGTTATGSTSPGTTPAGSTSPGSTPTGSTTPGTTRAGSTTPGSTPTGSTTPAKTATTAIAG